MTRPAIGRSMAAGLGVDLIAAVLLRGLSVATTVVVARSLSEDDYGAVSLALAVFGISDLLTNPALGVAVVRRAEIDSHTIDVAWTMTLMRAAILAVAIYVCAPFAAKLWHGTPQTATYLRILALAPLSAALANMHTLRLQRALRFGAAMLLDNVRLLAASGASLILLVVTRSAQSLVTGIIIGNLVHAALSWFVVAERPRFAFSGATVRELTSVSRWLMANSVLVYLCSTIDNLWVGRALGLAALGTYALAWRIVNTVVTLFTRAIAKMLIPAYRDVGHDAVRLRAMVLSTLFPSAAVGALGSGLVLLCAPELFSLIAGHGNYEGAALVARALTPFVYVRVLNNVLAPLYQGVGEPRTLTLVSVLNIILLVPAIYVGSQLAGAGGVAAAVSLTTTTVALVLVGLVARRFEIALLLLSKAMVLPLVAMAPALLLGSLAMNLFATAAARLATGFAVVTLLFFAASEGIRRLVPDLPFLLQPLLSLLRRRSASGAEKER